MNLSERKKQILCAIVEEYITTGEPVGSKFLAKESGMALSSATIRNEMAELAKLGYIEQPHTSAGRVPTHLGYRMYVDHLMSKYKLSEQEKQSLDRIMELCSGDVESTLSKAGDMLADITGCTAISTSPDDKSTEIRRIEVVPAGMRSILLVILTSSGIIKSSLCRITEDLTAEMLEFFSRLVNDRFCGRQLETITPEYVGIVKSELYEYTFALSPVIDVIADEVGKANGEIFVGGASNLLVMNEFGSDRVAEIMKFLKSREEIMRVIGDAEAGIRIRIGEENGTPYMDASALIAAPYAFKGKICGTVGIIGPTRINYAKMVSSIEYFSSLLSRLINESFGD